MTQEVSFKRNERVLYLNGSLGWVEGKIVGRGRKNGARAYDVTLTNGETYWGYTDQFRKL